MGDVSTTVDRAALQELLRAGDERFWPALDAQTSAAAAFEELLPLAVLRRKAQARGLARAAATPIKIALVGGFTFSPFRELFEALLAARGFEPKIHTGDFDNWVEELLSSAQLAEFAPDVIFVMPAPRRYRYDGLPTDPRDRVEADARARAGELLAQCRVGHQRLGAEIVLANFPLPWLNDLGALRTRAAGSEWTHRKLVNLELGLTAPPEVHICDAEHVAARLGGRAATDERLWFESKQPGSPAFLFELAREAAHGVATLKHPAHKVLVLDLDNTLWGGVVGDAGLEGIELGDTSPRGEAFKEFQRYCLALQRRGVLLAVCSKNDHERAIEPFRRHPEMVLREQHLVAFKANWQPKADNLRAIAAELNLGLDSLVFADDNPAEIDIVQKYAPEVKTVHLGEDPSLFVRLVDEGRFFEPRSLTNEDLGRTEQYQAEARRQTELSSATDMPAYLRSLEMTARIAPFDAIDLSRIVQLINKSNQFNLTTRRRTEAEVTALMADPAHRTFTIRLADRFGDHGLIAVVIGRVDGGVFAIDTWLMSCRVLMRQVEEATLNEIVRLALQAGCPTVRGEYLPTAKNALVKDLLPNLGFTRIADEPATFELAVAGYQNQPTFIEVRGA
jgi:FkbH-like protein